MIIPEVKFASGARRKYNNMEIKMYIKEGGLVVFECQGVLKEPLEKISFDKGTRLFSMVFHSGERVELDCPVDDETMGAFGDFNFCLMGFCDGSQILAATLVRMEGIN